METNISFNGLLINFLYLKEALLQSFNKKNDSYWRKTYWNQFLAFTGLKKTLTGERVSFRYDGYGGLECHAIWFESGRGVGNFATPEYDCTEIVLSLPYTGFLSEKEIDGLSSLQVDLFSL